MSYVYTINFDDCRGLRKWRLDSPENILHVLQEGFQMAEAALLQDPLGFGISPDLVSVGPEILTGTSQSTFDVDL